MVYRVLVRANLIFVVYWVDQIKYRFLQFTQFFSSDVRVVWSNEKKGYVRGTCCKLMALTKGALASRGLSHELT